jgi:hypothetical protein
MGASNSKFVLVGGLIILSVGFVYATVHNRPKTKVLVGGIGFMLLASILDAFGDGPSKLANAITMVAVVSVLIGEGPDLFTALTTAQTSTAPTDVTAPPPATTSTS